MVRPGYHTTVLLVEKLKEFEFLLDKVIEFIFRFLVDTLEEMNRQKQICLILGLRKGMTEVMEVVTGEELFGEDVEGEVEDDNFHF